MSAEQDSGKLDEGQKQDEDLPLFRQQVIEEQQTQWLGTVLLTPPISHTFFVWFAVLTAAGVLALLFFANFSRTENVSGWLVPKEGLVQVYSPRAGVISALHVVEGGEIEKGGSLLNVSTEVETESVGSTQEQVVKQLEQRRTSLAAERELQTQIFNQRINGLAARLEGRKQERERRVRELNVQRKRLALAEENSTRLKRVQAGVLSEQNKTAIENERLDQLMALSVIERDLAVFDRERITLETELAELPLERDQELASIDRRYNELGQELAEAESLRQFVVSSPQAGTITSMNVKLGGSVNPALTLLSIIPKGSNLEAQLFVPTSAIGFVKPGQEVFMRYRAFPYQKFGHYKGIISTVSRSTLTPGVVSPQVRSVSQIDTANEGLYSITVKLPSQSALAYGEEIALQPGMQLDADILIERRRLIEWVLDPLYTLTGTSQG